MMTNKNEDQETTGKLEVNTPHDSAVQKFLQEIEETVSKVFSEGGEIMATIAEKLIDKGVDKGKWDVVMNMLRERASINFISKVTGFTVGQIEEFKKKLREQQENAAA